MRAEALSGGSPLLKGSMEMLYEAYEAKMRKIATVLDKIRKHRVLILVCLALILLMIGAFLFFRGTLLSDAVAPSEPVTYGERVEFKGKALFGRTGSQYRAADGGEWVNGFPILPGEYVVRAVSNRSFGIKQYGAEQRFTVLKRSLTVSIAPTAVYGDAPEPVCYGMISGDRVDNISVKYSDPYAVSTEAVIESITVLNGDGVDVTSGYDASFNDNVVTFEKREITVETASAEKIYDGKPLSAASVTVTAGSAAYGDTVAYSSYPSVTDATAEVGAENRPSGLRIMNSDGADVTHMYSVTEESGILTVYKREISARSGSHEKVYDGKPFDWLTAEITGGDAAEGHVVAYRFANASLVKAGVFENLFDVVVTDAQGADVSRNYNVKKTVGELRIATRLVTVTASDRTWIFDGLVHSASTLFPRFTVSAATADGGLIEGHTLDCRTLATIHAVGEVENVPVEIKIKGEGGADVTANYDINAVSGTLTVIKRAITVTVHDAEFVYTGLRWTYPDGSSYYTVTAGEQATLPEGMAEDTALVESGSPLGGSESKPVTVDCRYTGGLERVGEAEISAQVCLYQSGDVTDCYDITVISGTITVVPRKITLTPERVSGVYNGKTVAVSEIRTTASYADTVTQTELAVRIQPVVWVSAEGGTVGEYISAINRWQILSVGGEDITYCFEITAADGVFEVRKRPIKVVFKSGEWVYDGLTHRIEGEDAYTVVSLVGNDAVALCEGHTMELTTCGEITDAGTEIHGHEGGIVVRDGAGEDVSGNYEITVYDGLLTVTRRPLAILIDSAEKVYNGTALTKDGFTITSGSVVAGETLSVETTGRQVDAGSTHNTATVTVRAGERDVTDNYDIAVTDGSLTVTPRPIVIRTGSAEKVYDGTVLAKNSYETVSGSVVDGHRLGVVVTGSRTNAGVGSNTAVVTVTANGENVTGNYDITVEEGTLTVTRRPVKFKVSANGFTYDGKERSDGEICWLDIVVEDGYYPLAEMQEVTDFSILFSTDTESFVGVVRLAGEYTVSVYSITVRTVVGVDADVTENYEFTFVNAALSVLPRPITVTAASGKFKYDGKTHYASELSPYYYVTYDGDPTEEGIVEGDVIKEVTVEGSIDVPGTAPSTVTKVTVSYRGEDRTFCYSVTTVDGVLTMEPSVITVVSQSAQKVYDGEALINHSYSVEGFMKAGDSIAAEFTGSQTEIGESDNLFTYTVKNFKGEDVSGNYVCQFRYGKLRVMDKPPESDMSGDIGNDKPDAGDLKTVFSYVATTDGRIYFRQNHFGDYDAVLGWLDAPEDESAYSYTYTMLAEALMRNRSRKNVTIKPLDSMLYLSTYYADRTTVKEEGRTADEYTVSYYQYDYLRDSSLPAYSSSMVDYEKRYRTYVYENYTYLPEETRSAMDGVIAKAASEAGVKLTSVGKKALVEWVCNYVKNAAEYDLDFPDFPDGVDKAVYFLTVAKRGVCRHFATSAVVMYRTLGIPARYVVGYASTAVANETVDVTGMDAHAWVEVYVDGIGWVVVDPTGGSGGGNGGEGDDTPTEKGKIVLVPYAIKKVYNGSPVSCGSDQFWIKSGKELLPDGYRIEVTIEGEQTNVGTTESRITRAVIYDADGNNITSQYDIHAEKGVIEVMPIKIVVYTASASKTYDGRKLSAEECSVAMGKLLEGHTLVAVGYTYIVNIGTEANTVESIEIYDKDGNKVTDCYEIEVREGTLTVTGG